MSDKKNVRIRLFKDNSRYKGDLFVSVNGVSYKIRRGVEVEVPPEVAEVLEHSQVQDERTAARIAAAENPCLLMRSTRITSAQSWMLPWVRRNVTPGSRPGITAFWPS